MHYRDPRARRGRLESNLDLGLLGGREVDFAPFEDEAPRRVPHDGAADLDHTVVERLEHAPAHAGQARHAGVAFGGKFPGDAIRQLAGIGTAGAGIDHGKGIGARCFHVSVIGRFRRVASSEAPPTQDDKTKIEQMAQEVYKNIKNRLRVEWERRNRF